VEQKQQQLQQWAENLPAASSIMCVLCAAAPVIVGVAQHTLAWVHAADSMLARRCLTAYAACCVLSPLLLLQPELQRVLYPVFVHIYLQLVSYGASQKAAELLQKYRCGTTVAVAGVAAA
jgi:hypothetical protein